MASKLAVQMFTLREHTKTAKDLATSLKRVADMGYPAVQMSAIGAMNGDNPEVDAATARKMLDDNGLKCIATHRPWPRLVDHVDEEIEFHKTLGCDYVAIGGAPCENSYEGYRKWLEETRPVIENLKNAGIRFGHHNHSHEFFRPERYGKTFEDIVIDEGGADLYLELDLYWVEHAGLNCVRILERGKGRVPVIHLKDKEVIQGKNETRMAPIGEGNMDWDDIIPACEAAGVDWYAVEQDQCYRDAFDCLQSSYDFLSSKGL
ncbi:MAG: sugar phosphate isomerase/epimerase family protein [Opitutales bacterium]